MLKFYVLSSSACDFAPFFEILSEWDEPRLSYDAIFQDGGRKSNSVFQFGDVLHLRTSKTSCIPNFDKIAQSMAEMLLFLFLKTNACHIEILLPVSI